MKSLEYIRSFVNIDKTETIDDLQDLLFRRDMLDCFEFCLAAREYFDFPSRGSASKFDMVGDSRLSGLPVYCSAPECRIRYADRVGAFAVLYTDSVSLINPFKYASHFISKSKRRAEVFIRELALSIKIVELLHALIDRGIIRFVSFEDGGLCTSCMTKTLTGALNSKSIHEIVHDHFVNTSTISVIHEGGRKAIKIEYDRSHEEHDLYADRPKSFFLGKVVGQILGRDDLIKGKLFYAQTNLMARDFLLKNLLADREGISSVFSNDFDLALVNSFATDVRQERGFQVHYPVLRGMTFERALAIRDAEWHHLSDFRAAVREAKFAVLEGNQDAREVARAEVSKIEGLLTRSQREANQALTDALLLGAFSIGAAVVTSGVAGIVSAAAGVLGGGHAVQKAVPALRKKLSTPEEVRASRYYLAWRIGRTLRDDA